MRQKKAIIIGAGPAGLTAALELLQRSDIRPIILESTGDLGVISKTVNYQFAGEFNVFAWRTEVQSNGLWVFDSVFRYTGPSSSRKLIDINGNVFP
jgi:monoamine oxidase